MIEETFIDFKCPSCEGAVSFPNDCAGLAQECPNCTETVVVPADGSGAGRKLPLPLPTPRLFLRRLHGGDWKDLLECLSDEELFRYQEARPMGEEDILHWLEADNHVKLTTPNQPFFLGLELQGQDKLIGYLTLSFTDPQRLQAALDIILNRSHRRQGFAVEALAGALKFCFDGIRLHRVTAYCDSRNVAGLGLFQKAGLRREGEFKQNRLVNGEWADTVWHALLREEYQNK